MAFLGQEEQIREFQDRFRYIYVVVFLGMAFLISRMVYLQILMGDKMRQVSEENRIKRVKVTAPRGMIFDRNHKLLIDNRPAFDLEIIPQYLRESKQSKPVIERLAKLVKMPEAAINDVLNKNRGQPPFLPVKIKTDLTREEVARIETWKIDMPGVEVREEIRRTNIYGEVASHLLGYIGEINPTELPQFNKDGPGSANTAASGIAFLRYKLGDNVGKFGLEQKMEEVLRGVDGEEIKEVDALGRVKLEKKSRVLTSTPDKPAVPGKNLILTIDQDLQVAANKAFGDNIGSVVAIDPKTGQILAMLSRPSFDPTEFSRGIPAALWAKLLKNENHPLRDKTIQDHYPPGSTFKIVTAIAGLEEGVIDEHTHFACSGSIRVGNRVAHCWKKGGHGNIDVRRAITESCDVFFYKTAQRLKSVDDIAKWAFKLGLGKKTGITLPREVPGLMPTEAWKMKALKQAWNGGETVYVAIGQSFDLVTTLQLANLYAGLGNGGVIYRPYLVKDVESFEGEVLKTFPPDPLDQHTLKPKTVELVKEGLWGVVNTPHGTAYSMRLPGMDFVGKTGTAQVIRISQEKIYAKCENMRFRDRHHGIFAGFAPLNDPRIAVGVIVEHGCHGGTAAAPVARAIIKTYLEKLNPELYGEKAIAERVKAQGKNPSVPMSAAKASGVDEEDVLGGETIETQLPDDNSPPPAPPGRGDVSPD